MAQLEIKRESDGKIVVYPTPFDWFGDYIWADGNYSCDCNRNAWFSFVTEDFADAICGQSRYAVRLTDESGNVLYQDGSFENELKH